MQIMTGSAQFAHERAGLTVYARELLLLLTEKASKPQDSLYELVKHLSVVRNRAPYMHEASLHWKSATDQSLIQLALKSQVGHSCSTGPLPGFCT